MPESCWSEEREKKKPAKTCTELSTEKRETAEVIDKSCRYEYQLKFNYMENAAKMTTPFRLNDLPK